MIYLHSSAVGTERANSVHVLAMVRAMAGQGGPVTLIAPEIRLGVAQELADLGVETIAARSKHRFLPRPLALLWATSRAVFGTRPVISRYLPVMLIEALRGRGHIVYDLHMPPHEMAGWIDRIFRLYLKRVGASHVRVISAQLGLRLAEAYGTGDLRVCHDASEDFALPDLATREATATGPLVVGFAGSLTRGKGFDLVADLARRLPNLAFHVAGKTDGVDRTDLPDNLILHGFLDRPGLTKFYAGCSIVLVPSQRDMATYSRQTSIGLYNSPLKLFEGMSAEAALIVSDLENLREVVDDQTALLCPPENTNAWAAALERLVKDPDLRHRLAQAARDLFLARYTWEARIAEMLR